MLQKLVIIKMRFGAMLQVIWKNHLLLQMKKIDENGGVGKATNEPLSKQAAVLQNTLQRFYESSSFRQFIWTNLWFSTSIDIQNSETVNKDLTNRLTMLGTLDNQNGGVWFNQIHGTGKLAQDGFGEAKTKTYAAQVGVDKKIGDNVIAWELQ